MTDLTPQRRARTAVTVAFAAQGFLLAALLTQLPRYESRFQLAASLIVVAVVTVSLIAGGGSILAEQIVRRSSSKSALVTGLVVIAGAGGAIGLAQSTATFFVLLGLYGLGVGIIDAAANMQAVSIQHAYGRVILSSFHAAWSAGAIAGALFVAAAVGLGISLTITQLSAGLVVACALAVIAPRFLSTNSGVAPSTPASASPADGSAVPARALLALGSAMAMFYAVDFSVGNWSALYLTNVLLTDAGTAALGIAAYQCAALLSRTTGDWWVRRHGEKTVVRAGALIGTAGLALVMVAQSPATAISGFLVVGFGVAVVAPLCFSAVGSRAAPGHVDAAIARINLFNYLGTLVGGGVVGALAALTDLRIAFVLPLVFTVVLFFLAPIFVARPSRDTTPTVRSRADSTRAPVRDEDNGQQRRMSNGTT